MYSMKEVLIWMCALNRLLKNRRQSFRHLFMLLSVVKVSVIMLQHVYSMFSSALSLFDLAAPAALSILHGRCPALG